MRASRGVNPMLNYSNNVARFYFVGAILGCTAAPPTAHQAPEAAPANALDRWKLALDTVCTNKTFDPAKELPPGSIAMSKVTYKCTLGDHWRDGPDKGVTGGHIYLDAQQVPSRIEFEALGERADLIGLMHSLTSRYGIASGVIARVELRLGSCKIGSCLDDTGEPIDDNSKLHVSLTSFGNGVSTAMLFAIVHN